jgi:hypothetical protein
VPPVAESELLYPTLTIADLRLAPVELERVVTVEDDPPPLEELPLLPPPQPITRADKRKRQI